jgi:hypothetical protein
MFCQIFFSALNTRESRHRTLATPAKESPPHVGARCQTEQTSPQQQQQPTFAAIPALPLRGHLQRTPIHCANTRHYLHATLYTPFTNHGQLQCAIPALSHSHWAKATFGGAGARDTFYSIQGELQAGAVSWTRWTRNTRMSVVWRRLTRRPSSKKVLWAK